MMTVTQNLLVFALVATVTVVHASNGGERKVRAVCLRSFVNFFMFFLKNYFLF